MINKSDVTIVIPHYDGELPNRGLSICLESLRESGFPSENIVVAFNGEVCDPDCLFGTGVRWIWVEEQGQCKAVNAAIATVNTPWVMVSNNDMVYPEDWFERLTRGTIEDLAAGGVSKDIVCLSPVLIEPQDGAPTFIKHFCGGLGGDWDSKKFFDYAKEHKGEGIRSGFNLPFLIKKEVWDLVGGYDVNYDPWGSNSDSDLEYKLKLAGIKMYQNTNCPVYHFSQTSGTFHPSVSNYWSKNWDYFIKKWGFPRTDDGIWTADFEIPMDKLTYHPFWEGFYSRKDS